MGPGMMGPGHMMGPGYGQPPRYSERSPYRQYREPLEKEDVRNLLENMLRSSRNPYLKVGKIEDKGAYFEAEIVTKESESLVDKLLVDKDTGRMRSAY
jgi:hypothetical protein